MRLRALALLALVAVGCGPKHPGQAPPTATPGQRPAPQPTPRPAPVDTTAAKRPTARTDTTVADTARKAQPPVPVDTVKPPKAAAKPAAPQPAERCILDLENTPFTRFQSVVDQVTKTRTTYLGGGFFGRCRNQDMTLASDSAEYFESTGLYHLFGNVHYREKRASMDSQKLTYFLKEERLLAEDSVVATLPSTSSMRGPRAEYFRAARGVRTQPRIVATGRPTLVMVEQDSATHRPNPSSATTLIANTVIADNDSLYYGSGDVVITRPDLEAHADSAFSDRVRGFARLMRSPAIRGKGQQDFKLWGSVIDLYSTNSQLDRVVAKDSAHVESKDLDLRSDNIDLRTKANKLAETFAWGPSRAIAKSADRIVQADSIHIVMPDQRVRRIDALRRAYVETSPDTTRMKSDEKDWLRGDTIIAYFDTVRAPRDTSSRPAIRELFSRGSASARYQMPPEKGKGTTPSINYVRGATITVSFNAGEVQTVAVRGKTSGVFLEPATDTTRTKANQRQQTPPQLPRRRP